METILQWLSEYWWAVLLVDVVVMKVLRVITKHFSEYTGVVRWCLFLVDLLDVVKSTPPPTKGDNR